MAKKSAPDRLFCVSKAASRALQCFMSLMPSNLSCLTCSDDAECARADVESIFGELIFLCQCSYCFERWTREERDFIRANQFVWGQGMHSKGAILNCCRIQLRQHLSTSQLPKVARNIGVLGSRPGLAEVKIVYNTRLS